MLQTKITTFRAFRNRNYALFFVGQSVSQIGTWMQRTAISWVVYSLSHSALMLGLCVFAQQFPSFVLSLFGGIVADRYSRYKILLITQTASMVQAILLALTVIYTPFHIWEILALSMVLGIINAFDVPARQPMVHEMIENKADIPNALALNATMVNLARLIGPAISGIILQNLGSGICFGLNALSFIAVLSSLLLMRLPKFSPPLVKKKVVLELKEGFIYVKSHPVIGLLIVMLTLLSLFVLPYDTVIPIFAKNIFKGNAETFGYINSFIGLGAIVASLFLASIKKETSLISVLLISIGILALALIGFALTPYFYWAMPLAILIGFGSMTPMTASITIIQMEAANTMKGRVMSYVALSYFGMLPLGGLLIGAVTQRTSAPLTLLGEGVVGLIIMFLFYFLFKNKLSEKSTEKP